MAVGHYGQDDDFPRHRLLVGPRCPERGRGKHKRRHALPASGLLVDESKSSRSSSQTLREQLSIYHCAGLGFHLGFRVLDLDLYLLLILGPLLQLLTSNHVMPAKEREARWDFTGPYFRMIVSQDQHGNAPCTQLAIRFVAGVFGVSVCLVASVSVGAFCVSVCACVSLSNCFAMFVQEKTEVKIEQNAGNLQAQGKKPTRAQAQQGGLNQGKMRRIL